MNMTARDANKAHRRYGFLWSFVEFLITLNAFILIVNILLFLMVITSVQDVKEEGINPKAEYITIMSWDNTVDCDVDIWVKNPLGSIIYFQYKDIDHMSLDRDDMGVRSDIVSTGNDEIAVVDNREYVTFRKMFEGEYVINMHLYACSNPEGGKYSFQDMVPAFNVHLELIDVNPNLKTVWQGEFTFNQIWQEQTALKFSIDDKSTFVYNGSDYLQLVRTNR